MSCQKKYTKTIYKNPCKFFWGFLCTNLLITAGLIGTGSLGFTPGGQYDWVISENKIAMNNDALRLAYRDTDSLETTEIIGERTRQSQVHNLGFIYNWDDNRNEDIYTSDNLKTICEIEKILFKNSEYNEFCYSQNGRNCTEIFTSVTNLFYPDDHNWECSLLDTSIVENKRDFIYNVEKNSDNSFYGFFLGKNFLQDNYTPVTRSNVNLGEPLKGYSSAIDKPREQRDKYIAFFRMVEADLLDYFGQKSTVFRSAYLNKFTKGNLQIKYYSWDLSSIEFNRVVNGDMIMTLCAIVFVFIWICVHTGSFFLSSMSMLQIVFSMPLAFLIYRFVFGINYFTQLHGTAIFLALGIGADDIFVFTDAWKQSKFIENIDNKLQRLQFTFSRTKIAVFNTSFTTTVAFLATAISPAMPISSFGIYAALTIICNYIFVLIFTPALMIIYTTYINKWCSCNSAITQTEENTDQDIEDLGIVHKIFSKIYYPIMNFSIKKVKIVSWVILTALTGYGIFSIYYATLLSPPVEQERWFTGGHMFNGFVDSMTNDFKTNNINEYAEVTIAWGINGVDRTDYNRWEPNDFRGEVDFKDSFSISTQAVRKHINNACNLIDKWECNEEGCSGSSGLLAIPNNTVCYIRDFDSLHSSSVFANETRYLSALKDFRSNTRPSINLKTWRNYIGVVKDDIKYVTVTFRSTLKSLQPMKVKEPVYKRTEALVEEINKNRPSELGDTFQDAGITWVWYDIEKTLISSMFNGLIICFPVSFLVLLFATSNWYLSLISIISIAFVVSNVLGFCSYFMGWTLGIAETVAAVIVIGFSIDYTLHIGHMYQESNHFGHKTREQRTRYALEKMGSTVLAGAITTAGSSMFMFACQMTFFYKMAVLISVTIFFSLIYSLGFLIAAMITIGPQHEFGSIRPIFRKCGILKKPNTDND